MILVWHFYVLFLKLWENLWIFRNLYSNATFRKADLKLKRAYLFQSSYRLAKSKGVVYGHTPLPTMKRILETCHIHEGTMFDLGCGEGRAALYANCFHNQKVLAIDLIKEFVQKAKSIGKLPNLTFQHKNIVNVDFTKANTVYFFATGFEEDVLQDLGEKMQSLPKGSKVITISEPIAPYARKSFYLWKQFEASFYFGKATVYCQIKK